MAQKNRPEPQSQPLPTPCPCESELRNSPEDMPMCRHSRPASHCRSCGCNAQGTGTAILAALEQQNCLLTELLAAVNGLTAACLYRK